MLTACKMKELRFSVGIVLVGMTAYDFFNCDQEHYGNKFRTTTLQNKLFI